MAWCILSTLQHPMDYDCLGHMLQEGVEKTQSHHFHHHCHCWVWPQSCLQQRYLSSGWIAIPGLPASQITLEFSLDLESWESIAPSIVIHSLCSASALQMRISSLSSLLALLWPSAKHKTMEPSNDKVLTLLLGSNQKPTTLPWLCASMARFGFIFAIFCASTRRPSSDVVFRVCSHSTCSKTFEKVIFKYPLVRASAPNCIGVLGVMAAAPCHDNDYGIVPNARYDERHGPWPALMYVVTKSQTEDVKA